MRLRRNLSAIGITLVLALAACSGAPEATTSAPGNPSPESSGGTETGSQGGSITISVGPEIPVFDPQLATGLANVGITNLVIEVLVYPDPETGEPTPGLAESWEPLEGGSVWRLNLRQGVEFTDGTPFDAEAVKFNLDRILDPATESPFRGRLSAVEEVLVVDDHTVDIQLTGPFGPFIRLLGEPGIGMNSPAQVDALGADYPTDPIGTGPFILDSFTPGQGAVLVANEDYWGGRPLLDEVRTLPIPDDPARVVALEAGDVQLIYNVPSQDLARLEDNPDLELLQAPGARAIELNINHSVEPFDDVRVRQALHHAIDKQALNETVFAGLAEVSTSFFTSRAFGYSEQEPYEYDVERARELLAEAGYPDGFETRLSYGEGLYLSSPEVAQTLQAMLGEAGIVVELEPIESATFLSDFYKPASENPYELAISGISNGPLDAWKGTQHYHGTRSGFISDGSNQMFYSNPDVDAALDTGETSADPEVRAEAYAEAQRLLWEDAVTVPLYIQPQFVAKSSALRDVFVRANETVDLFTAWLAD